ncbi:hypothetical protein DENSPDRAFT_182184 [Dentipellis sp. KUC8613]|nr:hypothetical protein DENSPDRAFT_182184 [Dentipellis sp. KUC8613]
MRAAVGNAFANGNSKVPQTPATNGMSKPNENGAATPSSVSSATGLNTPNRTPVLRTNTTAAPPVRPPAPQHVSHQQVPRPIATSAPVPPSPVPQNPPASERKVTFAQAPQAERQQSAQASTSRQPLAAMKSEPDLDRFFTASDDDAMMALDLEGLDDMDPEPSPVDNRNSVPDGASSATNGKSINNNTGQQIPRDNTGSATKPSALPSNSTGPASAVRASPGGFHFAHAPVCYLHLLAVVGVQNVLSQGNRPALATNGQARQPQQTSSTPSGAGMKRPAEAMQYVS